MSGLRRALWRTGRRFRQGRFRQAVLRQKLLRFHLLFFQRRRRHGGGLVFTWACPPLRAPAGRLFPSLPVVSSGVADWLRKLCWHFPVHFVSCVSIDGAVGRRRQPLSFGLGAAPRFGLGRGRRRCGPLCLPQQPDLELLLSLLSPYPLRGARLLLLPHRRASRRRSPQPARGFWRRLRRGPEVALRCHVHEGVQRLRHISRGSGHDPPRRGSGLLQPARRARGLAVALEAARVGAVDIGGHSRDAV
eukprot:scaffold492_cov257-Pinguiococcus_pyrenoidosus.AAC.24